MIRKLFKHEFLETFRPMLLLYGAILLTAGAGKVINLFAGTNPQNALLIMLNFVRIVNRLIIWLGVLVTIVTIVQRIYKSVFGKDGYLVMMLPTSPRSILYSKLAISLLWTVGTYCTSVFAFRLYNGKLPDFFSLFFDSEYGIFLNIMTAIVLMSIVVLIICGIYLSLSIGHLFKSKTALPSIFSSVFIFTIIGGLIFVIYNFDILNALLSLLAPTTLETLNIYGIPAIILFGAISAICFETSNFIISKHLNLMQ